MGTVLAGCFRNRTAVAELAGARGGPIAVIAAGERWSDGSLRPCFEDLCAAGAIIAKLRGTRSQEASLAAAAFSFAEPHLQESLLDFLAVRSCRLSRAARVRRASGTPNPGASKLNRRVLRRGSGR